MEKQIKCPRCHVTLLAHPASRCLDAWVAEYVMGWERLPDQEPSLAIAYKAKKDSSSTHQEPKIRFDIPYYSQDIAAAWQIVELLSLNNGHWRIYNNEGEWIIEYSRSANEESKVRAYSVMLGICYAAMQAVVAK